MEEEIPVPDWLTADYLHTCLHSDEKYKGAVIIKYSTSPAVPPGNNYGSNIYRVYIEYKDGQSSSEEHSLSIIVKAPLTNSVFEEFIKENSESNFYDKFLPEARKLLDDSFAPKRFNHPEKSIIVMEDLKAQGFLMADKKKMLSFEHCDLYMKAAAKFHAVSHAVCKQQPDMINEVNKNIIFTKDGKIGEGNAKVVYYALKCMANHVSQIDNYKEYEQLLKSSANSIWDYLVDATKSKVDFNCFTQGDPWITNMMFKYDQNGRPTDIKLVDFQGVSYSSPLQDIVLFICASASYDVQKNRIEDLFHVYLTELNSNLQKLNCSYQFSYEHLKSQVYKLTPIRIWLFAALYPGIQVSNPEFNKIFEKVMENSPLTENPFDKFYNENYCTTVLPQVLELMEKQGVFAYLADKQK